MREDSSVVALDCLVIPRDRAHSVYRSGPAASSCARAGDLTEIKGQAFHAPFPAL